MDLIVDNRALPGATTMDLYIDRDTLARSLARVQPIIERRSTNPFLAHVLLDAREGGLRMTATDTDIAFIGDLEANVRSTGQISVDANNLFQVIRSMPESTIQLSTGPSQRLRIQSGRSDFQLPGGSVDDFPSVPVFDGKGTATMAESTLRRLIEQTSFAIAQDDVRYGLNGAHLETRGEGEEAILRMVATDGHRLSAAEASFEGDVALTPRMLVPRKAMGVLKKLLDSGDSKVEVAFGEGAIRVTRENQIFWFRLLDGEFPDYEAVVPTDHRHRAMLRKSELVATLRRVGILVSDRARAVKFDFGDNVLRIQVHHVDRGEVKEEVTVELEGEPISVGFNVRYLLDILSVLESEHVVLELAHPLAPCMVKGTDDSSAFFVVMPMRLD
jgi:DNA polymerase III subunit beta